MGQCCNARQGFGNLQRELRDLRLSLAILLMSHVSNSSRRPLIAAASINGLECRLIGEKARGSTESHRHAGN
jgi:hypothetical protein